VEFECKAPDSGAQGGLGLGFEELVGEAVGHLLHPSKASSRPIGSTSLAPW